MSATTVDWLREQHECSSLEVRLLGVVDYDSAAALQDRLHAEIAERSDRLGALVICEHPPVVTVGREGGGDRVGLIRDELAARLIDLRWVARGGGTLMHLPGQLVVYPIVPLSRLSISVVEFRRRLLSSLIAVCRDQRVDAWDGPDGQSVRCRLGRIASVGVAVRDHVTFHGMFLNVNPNPNLLQLMQATSIAGRLTSLSSQRMSPVSMQAVRESTIRHLAEMLGYSEWNVYTGHPLLRRDQKKVYDYA